LAYLFHSSLDGGDPVRGCGGGGLQRAARATEAASGSGRRSRLRIRPGAMAMREVAAAAGCRRGPRQPAMQQRNKIKIGLQPPPVPWDLSVQPSTAPVFLLILTGSRVTPCADGSSLPRDPMEVKAAAPWRRGWTTEVLVLAASVNKLTSIM
ncbi:unnamed protein product, partial [Urochloa humidicola]